MENSLTDLKAIYKASDNIVARQIEDELIIVPIENNIADFDDAIFSFNETGRRVWDLINGELTIESICNLLASEYDSSLEEIKKDVCELTSKLLAANIIIRID